MEAGTNGLDEVSDRVWTIPNALTMLRLAGVPLFLWLVLRDHIGAALLLLGVSGATDYLDGQIARRTQTVTRLGQLLDPAADRLTILTTLLGLVLRGVVPWWFAALLLARDVAGVALVHRVRRAGFRGLPVHFVGKAATFTLFCAFPLLLLAEWQPGAASAVLPIGWAFAWWGVLLYWSSCYLYVVQARRLLKAASEVDAEVAMVDSTVLGLPGTRCTPGDAPLGS